MTFKTLLNVGLLSFLCCKYNFVFICIECKYHLFVSLLCITAVEFFSSRGTNNYWIAILAWNTDVLERCGVHFSGLDGQCFYHKLQVDDPIISPRYTSLSALSHHCHRKIFFFRVGHPMTESSLFLCVFYMDSCDCPLFLIILYFFPHLASLLCSWCP
jgi:hypothetical protein